MINFQKNAYTNQTLKRYYILFDNYLIENSMKIVN